MALKSKEIKSMGKEERENKLKELKVELAKSKVGSAKSGPKTKEIKKMIARILTLK